MCYQPTPSVGLVVGGAYYVLDRLADPNEVVTVVRELGEFGLALVRGASGLEFPVARDQLAIEPPDQFYRRLRATV